MKPSSVLILLLFVLASTFLVYAQGLTGGFIFDDIPNIINNDHIKIDKLGKQELLHVLNSGFSGVLKRPISMLSFGLNYYFTGFSPYYFKLVNLIIHLINGILAFILTLLLLESYRKVWKPSISNSQIHLLALIVAAGWLLHPIQLTSVLYIVQRMTSLAALFTLSGLVFYVWGRLRMLEGKHGAGIILFGIIFFGILGIFSKENAALLPLYILIVESIIFRFTTYNIKTKYYIYTLLSLILVFPAILVATLLIINPEVLIGGYSNREFTLQQRLLTEPRIIWTYIHMILLPNNAKLGLFHDDFEISHGFFDPITTIVSILGLAGLFILTVIISKRAPIVALGILFFLSGHALESTIFPLELFYEHRNYLPSYGIILSAFYILAQCGYKINSKITRIAVPILILLFAFNTSIRAKQWSDPLKFSLFEVEHHPNSFRANYEAGRTLSVLLDNPVINNKKYIFSQANIYFQKAIEIKPEPIGFISKILLNINYGKKLIKSDFHRLLEALSTKPINSSTTIAINNLFQCKMAGNCLLPDEQLTEIIQAIGSNPYLKGRFGAIIATSFSEYLANYVNDYKSALFFSQLATQLAPAEIQPRLNLANLLIVLRDYNNAEEQLKLIEQKDFIGAYSSKIQSMRNELNKFNDKKHI